ncbi:retrovirus-related pol polyprotein from transposon TNT 1-94 [Tanacetum coccineum]
MISMKLRLMFPPWRGVTIGDPGSGMLTRAMAKLSAASAHEYLFVDFLSKEEPKKERLVAQDYNQQEGIDNDETFAPVARLEEIRIFLTLATYMNFHSLSNDVKSAFLNGKLKEEVYAKQPPGFESMKTSSVPLNNLGPDLNGKAVYETQYKGFDLKDAQTLTILDATWTGKALQVPIFYDNTSVITISNNLVMHSRTKHVDIRYHFIRDHILKEDIELHFIPTQYQLADIFTKPMDEPTFKRLIVEPDQVEFIFEEIAFTTNNEVALLYPLTITPKAQTTLERCQTSFPNVA